MLRMQLKRRQRRVVVIILAIVVLVFGGTLGSIEYFGSQALAKQQADTQAKLAAYDKQIAAIKAKKKAEKEAAEKKAKEDAARKAAADAALAAQQAGKIVTPTGCAISGAHGNPNNIDVVVNKKHCFNPINFVPSDLTTYGGFAVSAKIVPSLSAMFDAASSAGVPIGITSAYRSYSDQVATYNNWVRVNGRMDGAVVVKLYGDGALWHTTEPISDRAAHRLPKGRFKTIEIQVESAGDVTSVVMVSNTAELVVQLKGP